MRNSIVDSIKTFFAKENLFKNLRNLILLLAGTFVLSLGSGFLLIPFQIVSGGITGITILTSDFIAPDIMSFILSRSLFLIGFIVLGFKFTVSSLISTIFYPVFLSLILRTGVLEPFLDVLIPGNVPIEVTNGVITNLDALNIDIGLLLLIGILGGAFTGVGCSLTFHAGGSTGGLDILTFIVSKFTGIKESIPFFCFDGSIVIIGIIVNVVSGDNSHLITGIIGIVAAFITSMLIELIYSGNTSAYMVDIISNKSDEMLDFILHDLDRSATIFEVTGGYTKEKRIMIRVCFSRREYTKIKNGIAKIDKNAFCMFNQTLFVGGEGFDKIKTSEFESFKYIKKINELKNKNEEKVLTIDTTENKNV